ncbi:dTDP-4-dehydrorhamnose 3,5-epimerase [Pontibacter qinzhouensis]|uniref:dTDP-4-dehydrorhamnose 3,5-epimerase n=1 Tax=Pontibacter qinzhouensis TaxID=2603253 RepID=A0A5C8JAZ8_9BACT|nr:dTDP-4-dehydrorhamnose 3,5-epimerase [Pontibacter qinzhouensis]TXK33857.1 dTDP-4-dehydrorhamnose 3,5-epimerase [Pontibacter qinzhouensis]
MIFTETKLKGAYIVDVKRIEDDRGFFGRAWCKNEFDELGLSSNVVQTNLSSNKKKGTLRGMHFQVTPHAESKLVRCTRGALYDVIIDLREDSPTYMQWLGVELTADSFRMLYVPENFAHGFLTLQDNTDIMYQVTEFYAPAAERGIRYNDPSFNIAWPMKPQVISEKDLAHADFVHELAKPLKS